MTQKYVPASPHRPPASCTWAPPEQRFIHGPLRGTSAVSSFFRIEDTDVARSTQDSVDQIIASMKWLGLDHDEGPIYQMQRLDRYRAVVDQLIDEGKAYRCYSTPEELDAHASPACTR